MLGPKKFWVQKNFGSKKILGPKKNFWSKKISGQKKFLVKKKILVQKPILGSKNFGTKKILGPKKFWVQKNFGWKKIVGPKKFRPKKSFWSNKNVRSKKILGPKEILAHINILGLRKILVLKFFWFEKKLGSKKIWVQKVVWTVWSMHTKSWPPTIPRTLRKVFGGGLSFGLGLGPRLTILHIQSRPFTSSTQALSLSGVWNLRPKSFFRCISVKICEFTLKIQD